MSAPEAYILAMQEPKPVPKRISLEVIIGAILLGVIWYWFHH